MNFQIGDNVWYEVQRRDKDDFRVPAMVVGLRRTRVVVSFSHWDDGRIVRRRVQPHRLSPRGGADGGS